MDREQLLSALRDAIEQARKASPAAFKIDRQLTIFPETLDQLETVIRSDPDLRLFDGPLWSLAQRVVEPRNLAVWLVSRAHDLVRDGRSIEVALDNLQDFLQAEEIRIEWVAALAGVTVDGKFALREGLTLRPFSRVTDAQAQERMRAAFGDFGPSPGVALTKTDVLHREQHGEPADAFSKKFDRFWEESDDVCRILAVSQDCAPGIVAIWVQTEKSVPCGDLLAANFATFHGPRWKRTKPGTADIRLEDVQPRYDRYLALQERDRTSLGLCIDRLRLAGAGFYLANSAIDLGIGFEVLFFHGKSDRDEITFKLKMRAAHFLATDPDERKKIGDLVGRIYGLRSRAVHTGKFDIFGRKRDNQLTLLDQGRQMLSDAVIRVIDEGQIPDWEALVYR